MEAIVSKYKKIAGCDVSKNKVAESYPHFTLHSFLLILPGKEVANTVLKNPGNARIF